MLGLGGYWGVGQQLTSVRIETGCKTSWSEIQAATLNSLYYSSRRLMIDRPLAVLPSDTFSPFLPAEPCPISLLIPRRSVPLYS
jgi:hypothetical protein